MIEYERVDLQSQFVGLYIIMEEKQAPKLPANYQPGACFHVELTADQFKALSLAMPKGYSLHVDHRKKDKSHSKKKTPEELLLAMSEPTPKSHHQPVLLPPPQHKKIPIKQDLIPEAVKPCLRILDQLKQHKCAWPFLQPVDVQVLGIPEYHEIIKEPMDFSTIEVNLKSGHYQTPGQFHQDVMKIFNNSYIFNEGTQMFIKVTQELEKYYYKISGQAKAPQERIVSSKTAQPPSKQQKKKKKPPTGSHQSIDLQPVSTEEKKQLAYHIHRLAKEHIKGVRSIVFDSNSQQNQFDLEKLSQKKLRQLQKYIRIKLAEQEINLRSNMLEKTQHQNLDELESEVTQQFIDQPLEDN